MGFFDSDSSQETTVEQKDSRVGVEGDENISVTGTGLFGDKPVYVTAEGKWSPTNAGSGDLISAYKSNIVDNAPGSSPLNILGSKINNSNINFNSGLDPYSASIFSEFVQGQNDVIANTQAILNDTLIGAFEQTSQAIAQSGELTAQALEKTSALTGNALNQAKDAVNAGISQASEVIANIFDANKTETEKVIERVIPLAGLVIGAIVLTGFLKRG